jgi:hypothetical protein
VVSQACTNRQGSTQKGHDRANPAEKQTKEEEKKKRRRRQKKKTKTKKKGIEEEEEKDPIHNPVNMKKKKSINSRTNLVHKKNWDQIRSTL